MWVTEGGYLRPIHVQIGLTDGARTQITGEGIDGDQGDLEPGARILTTEPGEVAFELVEPARHGILGKALERYVEGGGDSGAVDGLLLELLADVVGEVRSGLARPGSRRSAQRVSARALV